MSGTLGAASSADDGLGHASFGRFEAINWISRRPCATEPLLSDLTIVRAGAPIFS